MNDQHLKQGIRSCVKDPQDMREVQDIKWKQASAKTRRNKVQCVHQIMIRWVPLIGVWSYESPKPTSESMLRVPNLDSDARRVHGGLSWFGQKKTLRLAGREEYCISLHLSACVGVTSCERGNRSQVSERKWKYKGDCLRCWSSMVGRWLVFFRPLSAAPM
jgi:hypothetical protein